MRALATRLALGVLASAATGCVPDLGKSLHQVSLLEVTNLAGAGKVRPVEATGEQEIVLFTSSLDYPDHAMRDLLATCPRGRIVNITARHSTDLGFFAYRSKIVLRGYCLE